MRKFHWTAIILGLVGFAGYRIYIAATNRTAVQLTCAQFLSSPPSAKWVRLTDCDLDYDGAMHLASLFLQVDEGTVIPVRPRGQTGTPRLLLKLRRDPANADIIPPSLPSPACEQEGTSAAGTVRGMVLVGLSLRQEEQDGIDREVRKGHVLPDYVVIADGGKPDDEELAVSIFIAVSAVLVGSLLLRNWVRRRRREQVLSPPLPTIQSQALNL